MKRISVILLVAVILITTVLLGCSPTTAPAPATTAKPTAAPTTAAPSPSATAAQKWPDTISIASFPKGSIAYPVATAMAQMISKYNPTTCVLREYAGGAPGTTAVYNGDVLTFLDAQADYIADYWEKGKDIRELTGNLFVGGEAFAVRPSDNIKTVKDLAGKIAMTKTPSAHEVSETNAIFKAAGILDKITQVDKGTIADTIPAMINKKIDVFWQAMAIPAALEIKQSVGIDWLTLTPEEAKAAVDATPGDILWTAPKWVLDMYGFPADRKVNSIAFTQGLGVLPTMPDYIAYGILDALYTDNRIQAQVSVSNLIPDITLKNAVTAFEVPLHNGAIKYYKDKGVWTPELEAKQAKLLARQR